MNVNKIIKSRMIPYYFALVTQVIIQIWLLLMIMVDLLNLDPSRTFWNVHLGLFITGIIMGFITTIIPASWLKSMAIEEQWTITLSGMISTFLIVTVAYSLIP